MPKALLVKRRRGWKARLVDKVIVTLYPKGHKTEKPFGRLGEPNWQAMNHVQRTEYAPGGAKVVVVGPVDADLHLRTKFFEDGRRVQKGLYYLPLMRVISTEARRRVARKQAAVDRAYKALAAEIERAWSEAKPLQADCDVHQTFRGVEGVAFKVVSPTV